MEPAVSSRQRLEGDGVDVDLYLAYDGSINGDWIARYGILFSAATDARRLNIIHVNDGSQVGSGMVKRLVLLEAECQALAVEPVVQLVPQERDVYTTLLATVPAGDGVYCICGARTASRGKGFLAGTVSQRLLRSDRFNTLALRVVNPGLMGCPSAVMFPLAGHPRRFKAAMVLLHLLSPCVKRLILLRVMTVNTLLFRYLPVTSARRLHRNGAHYLQEVVGEIEAVFGDDRLQIDDHVQIGDDWAKEVVVQAGKTRAGLLLLGASDRFFRSRFNYGSRIEWILRNSPCDVGVYRRI